MDKYQENGYENREDYLYSLAEEYDYPYEKVKLCAELLGPEEDFDGLVCSVEDAAAMGI